MATARASVHERDFAGNHDLRGSRRKHSRVLPLMAAYWSFLFLAMLASGKVGALLMGDTLSAALLSLAALSLSPLVVLVGIGMSVVRRTWAPLWMATLNLVVSVCVCYATLVLELNVPILDFMRGKGVIISTYIGTQNSAVFTLRSNGNMDVLWTGWPGAKAFYGGTYQLHGSDLRLQFKGAGPPRLSGRAVVGTKRISFFDQDGHETIEFEIVHAEPEAVPR